MKTRFLPGFGLLLVLTWTDLVWADPDIAASISALSRQIERQSDNQVLRLQRAMLYADNNQPEAALADVRLVELGGRPAEAAYAHGYLLYAAGDYDAALPYFDQDLEANPRHQQARIYRARLLRDSGRYEQALADYEALMELTDSLDPGYYLIAAQIMAALPDRGVAEALSLLDARMEQVGPVSPLQRYAIALEQDRGNFQGALDRMAGLDQRLKATQAWQLEVAKLCLLAGQADAAQSHLALAREQLESARATVANRELAIIASDLQEELELARDRERATAAQAAR